MNSLKALIIRNGNFSEAPKYLSNSLEILESKGYFTSFELDGLSKVKSTNI